MIQHAVKLSGLLCCESCRREADNHLKETKKADKTVKKLNVKLKHYEGHKQHVADFAEISSVRLE